MHLTMLSNFETFSIRIHTVRMFSRVDSTGKFRIRSCHPCECFPKVGLPEEGRRGNDDRIVDCVLIEWRQ